MLGWFDIRRTDVRRACWLGCWVLMLCSMTLTGAAQAQTGPQPSAGEQTAESLPDTRNWLQRMARGEPGAVLGTIALARLLESLEAAPDADMQTVIGRVSTDMARLRSLANHYTHLPIILQPAGVDLVDAITVAELDQQGLLLWQAEQEQVDQRLATLATDTLLSGSDDAAAGWLATALRHFYPRSGQIWSQLQALDTAQPELVRAAVSQLDLAADPADIPVDNVNIENVKLDNLEDLLRAAEAAEPISADGLARVRYDLLRKATDDPDSLPSWQRQLAMAELAAAQDRSLERLLGLLNLEAQFSQQPELSSSTEFKQFQRLKARLLPILAEQLARLDPELMPMLAWLENGEAMSDSTVLDARSLLHLGVEDASFYLSQPVRTELAEEIDICLSIAGNISQDSGSSQMSAAQFEACLDTYLELVREDASSAELSGDPDGPFSAQTRRRELNLVVWQRINYLRGYIEEAFTVACSLEPDRLPNPLEWAILASQFRWLADFLPEYFNAQGSRTQNMRKLDDMISSGRELIAALIQQVDCATGEGAGSRDPMYRALASYRETLAELRRQVEQVKAEFERQRLRPGADIRVAAGATQETGYRPEQQSIEPCDPEQVCEMSGPLQASRALFGLFPSEYLVADQSGMGEVSLCYDEISWLDRERNIPRSGDERMANYSGRFSMVLRGRYRQSPAAAVAGPYGSPEADEEPVVDVFAYQLQSPQRQEYLFAPNRDEILADSCPTEYVGEKLVAELPERRWHIVPNRLTFLAGARALPSRLLAENWARGAEWRDWFINGNNIRQIEAVDGSVIRQDLDRHLAALAIANESAVYRALLGNQVNAASEALAELSAAALVVRKVAELFYPQQFAARDEMRRYLSGEAVLLDRSGLRLLQQRQVPVSNILPLAEERLQGLEQAWAEIPQATRFNGSLPGFVSRSLLLLLDLKQRTEATSPALGVSPLPEVAPAGPVDPAIQEPVSVSG